MGALDMGMGLSLDQYVLSDPIPLLIVLLKSFLENKKENKIWNKILDNNIQNDAEHYLLIIALAYGFSGVGLDNNKKNYKVHASFLNFLWYWLRIIWHTLK